MKARYLILCIVPLLAACSKEPLQIGSKEFTENILLAEMFAALAEAIAVRKRGFMLGSGRPERVATVSSRMSLAKTLARFASCAPLRYIIFLNCEWPAIVPASSSYCGY